MIILGRSEVNFHYSIRIRGRNANLNVSIRVGWRDVRNGMDIMWDLGYNGTSVPEIPRTGSGEKDQRRVSWDR